MRSGPPMHKTLRRCFDASLSLEIFSVMKCTFQASIKHLPVCTELLDAFLAKDHTLNSNLLSSYLVPGSSEIG